MPPVLQDSLLSLSSRLKVVRLVEPRTCDRNAVASSSLRLLQCFGGRIVWAARERESEGESVCHTPEA